MARIFVNGISAKSGGGASILTNYLALARRRGGSDHYFVVTPDAGKYSEYASDCVSIVDVKSIYKRSFMFPILHTMILPRLIRELDCDRILNLADIPIPTNVRQCFLFDWSYAIYPRTEAWRRMSLSDWLYRKAKLQFYRRYCRYPAVTVTQTRTAGDRLIRQYGVSAVKVIPNAVSTDHFYGGEPRDFMLPSERIKLLCLSHYYSHKNIEVFIPLAEMIQKLGLPYLIVTTIDASQSPRAEKFLDQVESRSLENIIRNIGPVSMRHVPALYSACDALLLPTLLESFSGTYVEAMFHEKPILTSDYDFARDVCGEHAFYFDPLSARSILQAIQSAFADAEARKYRVLHARERLESLPAWDDVFVALREAVG